MAPLPIPERADDITAGWMQQALTAGGASDFPAIETLEVTTLSDVTNALGSLFRCRMIAGGGAPGPASVIVKIATANPLAFRMARWLSLHRREFVFYRDIAAHARMRVPALVYGDFDERSHRFVLVLEDLGGMEAIAQIDGVGVERARRAIREAATLQGRFWEAPDDPALASCGAFLTTRERRIMQTIYLLTLPAAFDRFSDCFTTATSRLADAFGTRVAAHFAAIAAGPGTLVHGDYRGDNVLFGGAGRDDFAVIDWQGCGIGCGMYDVAFFLATSVTVGDRRRVERDAVAEYHDIVCRMGATNYTFADCWRSYRQNILGTLMPMVIGCGAIKMDNQAILHQTRELLGRTLTAIEDLDAGEFLPPPDRPWSSEGAFSMLSRGGFKAYTFLLGLRKRPRD